MANFFLQSKKKKAKKNLVFICIVTNYLIWEEAFWLAYFKALLTTDVLIRLRLLNLILISVKE